MILLRLIMEHVKHNPKKAYLVSKLAMLSESFRLLSSTSVPREMRRNSLVIICDKVLCIPARLMVSAQSALAAQEPYLSIRAALLVSFNKGSPFWVGYFTGS